MDLKREVAVRNAKMPTESKSTGVFMVNIIHWRRLVFAASCLLIFNCHPQTKDDTQVSSTKSHQQPIFSEQAQASGLDFVHQNGMKGEYHFPEIIGSGGALFDYDQDGDLDLYLCQGQQLGSEPLPIHGRLFRNDTTQGELKFTDVTAASGIVANSAGMGAASADYDNDGLPDLYLLNFGSNALWRNLGDGRFENVTQAANADDPRWSVSASFADFDRDGWLDLFIVNYVDYTVHTNKDCILRGRDYCNPQSYKPVPDRLLRNKGDGTFEDVTAASQVASQFGNGLGIASLDFDMDGWLDFYVANDGTPNQLWRNLGNGRFEEAGLLSGAALNLKGQAEASMGISAGDYDNDGDLDLFMTHLRSETNTLFQNLSESGQARFRDHTIATKLAAPSRSFTGFGTHWFDADNDGWLDLFATNGSVAALEDLQAKTVFFPYAQSDQLFRNKGDGTFEDISLQAGDGLQKLTIGRGALFGDLDNDGDTDIVINDNHSSVRLLRNDLGSKANWLGIRVVDSDKGRDLLGTQLRLRTKSGRELIRVAQTDGSYASANDPRVLFGLGDDTAAEVTARWPNGTTTTFPLDTNRAWITLKQP